MIQVGQEYAVELKEQASCDENRKNVNYKCFLLVRFAKKMFTEISETTPHMKRYFRKLIIKKFNNIFLRRIRFFNLQVITIFVYFVSVQKKRALRVR